MCIGGDINFLCYKTVSIPSWPEVASNFRKNGNLDESNNADIQEIPLLKSSIIYYRVNMN